ncbi:uncharacterized protein LOC112527050 isoform X2 [Cynara cardunculus var. scolymus]|uniref:uncharacterized protein LOC112527050 isoform X2 n=1 Tax=Cynara cardunculus var. scolymus TaxID=59895 RepID=UPI000D627A74|nr:uncharacterized protein LOC112527050 isoform X2 [Cynara cardunculus var. scolymus]
MDERSEDPSPLPPRVGSKVNVFVSYNGVWEVDGTYWIFKDAESSSIPIDKDVTYMQITDILYDALEIDKLKYDLKLEVAYTMDGQPFKPIHIKRDFHVTVFMEETLKKRTPLCVTLVNKDAPVAQLCNSPSIKQARFEGLTCVPKKKKKRKNVDPSPTFARKTRSAAKALVSGADPIPILNDDHVANLSNDDEGQALGTSSSPQENLQLNIVQKPIRWSAPMFTKEDIMASNQNHSSTSIIPLGELFIGQTFDNKIELKTKAALHAMKSNFEFQVKKSGTDVWYITCKDPHCFWRLRGKKLKGSSMFRITSYRGEHACSLAVGVKDHRQAAPWIVGHLIKNKYVNEGTSYLANDIRGDMKKQYGIDMSYEKAWRCREKALMYVRGAVGDSYSKLPAYLYMLQERNPGTITDFVTEDGHFLYCFFALGASRIGFKACRPVICVDGTFLKTKYGGYMLCAVALDANNQLFPIAHAIVDSENHNSYCYFMRKLKEVIGDVDNLAFVSDRHTSIVDALETVFPNAYHGACYHHISMNVKHKFKTDHCHQTMFLAAHAFRKTEFQKHFDAIKEMNPAIAEYLEGIGFDRWSRAYFPGNRYNIMTSNYAESFNTKTKEARTFPITTFVEFIRFTLQTWFCERRDEAIKCTAILSNLTETDLTRIADKSRLLNC